MGKPAGAVSATGIWLERPLRPNAAAWGVRLGGAGSGAVRSAGGRAEPATAATAGQLQRLRPGERVGRGSLLRAQPWSWLRGAGQQAHRLREASV
eukprot:9470693-Pyramimonas_sp.AAC.1